MTEQEEIDVMREEINLTTNLFYETYNEKEYNEKEDALFYLLNPCYKDTLDKCYYSVLSYKLYECYSKEDFKRQIKVGVDWADYEKNRDTGNKSTYRLFNEKNGVILSGEVLNSTNNIIKCYIDDINNIKSGAKIEEINQKENNVNSKIDKEEYKYWATLLIAYFKHHKVDEGDIKIFINNIKKSKFKLACENANSIPKEYIEGCVAWFDKFSCLAKMFFHLATTIGNVMPWPLHYNYNPKNDELDIVQTKYQYYIGLYSKVDNTGIDKGSWIKAFVEGYYLQDFITNDMTRAIEFLNLDKVCKQKDYFLQKWFENIINKINNSSEDDIEKWWNLYFYRASKAIMKRSYRILTGKNPNAETEFTNAFTDFCVEYGIKNEIEELIGHLSKYEDQKIKGDKFLKIEGEKIDDELQELKKLKEILQRKSEELTN